MQKPAQRTTRQRTAVAQVLSHQEGFRTAQQVHDELRAAGESVGLTTVYRTLSSMAEAGELDVVRTVEGELSYKRCVSEEHHHHLVCNGCLKSVVVDADVIDGVQAILAKQHSFHEVDHDLEFRGLCDDCWRSENAPS